MKHLAKSTLIVAFFFGIDKILGFVRQVLVGRQFSLSYELDVFNAANNIPDLLSSLISGGALGIALIPVLSEYLGKKMKKEAWSIFTQILNLAFIVTGSLAILIYVLAPWMVENVVAPGFPPDQKELTIELMRLDLVAILIFSISGLVMAGLQANQHFLLPALAPGLYNIGQIIGVLILAPKPGYSIGPIELPGFGMGIKGLVFGVIFGAFLHLLIQIPGLIKYGFKWSPQIPIHLTGFFRKGVRFKDIFQIPDPGIRKVFRLLGPRILTMFFIQMFFIVRDNLASGLGEGSVTALNYGWFIMQVPETLLGTAMAITLLPTISELFATGDTEKFTTTINSTAKILIALTIPAACLIFAGINPVIEKVFHFGDAGTALVTATTRMYLVGLTGHALLEIATRSFYAQQNAKIPLIAAALNATFYLILAPIFSRWLGVVGIALANVTIFTTEAVLLFWILNRKYQGIFSTRRTLIRVLLPGLIVGGSLFAGIEWINFSPFLVSIAGMVVGLFVMIPFMLPEIKLLFRIGIDTPRI